MVRDMFRLRRRDRGNGEAILSQQQHALVIVHIHTALHRFLADRGKGGALDFLHREDHVVRVRARAHGITRTFVVASSIV